MTDPSSVTQSRSLGVGEQFNNVSESRCLREMGTPGPHIPSDMGTGEPHITRDVGPWGPQNSGDMGTLQ